MAKKNKKKVVKVDTATTTKKEVTKMPYVVKAPEGKALKFQDHLGKVRLTQEVTYDSTKSDTYAFLMKMLGEQYLTYEETHEIFGNAFMRISDTMLNEEEGYMETSFLIFETGEDGCLHFKRVVDVYAFVDKTSLETDTIKFTKIENCSIREVAIEDICYMACSMQYFSENPKTNNLLKMVA